MVKIKILIVDDEEDYCMIMQSYFESKDYEVSVAYTLKEGLKLLHDKSPDIIFLDNNLPDGEGWKHARKIVHDHPLIKINLISAYKQRTDDLSSNANVRIWEKPISMDSLEEVFA